MKRTVLTILALFAIEGSAWSHPTCITSTNCCAPHAATGGNAPTGTNCQLGECSLSVTPMQTPWGQTYYKYHYDRSYWCNQGTAGANGLCPGQGNACGHSYGETFSVFANHTTPVEYDQHCNCQ